MLDLRTPLVSIVGIKPSFATRFKKLGITSIRDLLYHFPVRYEDFSQIYEIENLEPGQYATIQGTVQSIRIRNAWRKRMVIVEAKIDDGTGTIHALWFNQPYVKNILRPGVVANFSGKVTSSDEELHLSHPTYELVGKHETKHTARLVPIYPETKGLTSKGIRYIMQPILENLGDIPDWLPDNIKERYDLPEISDALRQIHFPNQLEDAENAKKRFSFEDLFLLQLMNLEERARLEKEKAPTIEISPKIKEDLKKSLPFSFTETQNRSFEEIISDLKKQKPMNRLLQGDVGSGKTAVAALGALVVALGKHQTAIMAPTEVLAKQHYHTFQSLFEKIDRKYQSSLGLMTSAHSRVLYENDLESEVKKEDLKKLIEKGEVKIVIGTHALLQKSITFKKLGLVIIDEQHRFGVEQRANLTKRSERREIAKKEGKENSLPHFLSMSATPIPRTLMLTIFGDLDISTIDELPKGRKEIITKAVSPEDRIKAYGVIRGQIEKGRQAFVICPRIEPAETEAKENKNSKLWEVKSVKEEYEKLQKNIFPQFKVGLLHGQMKPKEKEAIMHDFREGRTQILVSTSVIEVGVNVPNATIMMIEGSDRFGLAQLYQFRGRVGRGSHQSFCFLFSDSSSQATNERLKAIVEAKNGFDLAERDLSLRGPGEFIGQKQTGLPDIAMRNLQNKELIRTSRQAATEIIESDPEVKKYPLLRIKLQEFTSKIHLE